jgi:D-3-phosphoglycerate dehydrogenase / 2-oxoglutarate reductase
MSFEVLATDKVAEDGLAPLVEDERFHVVIVPDSRSAEFADALPASHALVVRSATAVDKSILDLAPNLRVIGRAGVGVDNIDLEAATTRGIAVFNAPEGNTVAAAELTMALILALARHVIEADRVVHLGGWDRSRFQGVELKGRTLGLIGAGRIGGEVARRCQAFGMSVIAADPYLDPEDAGRLGISLVSIDEVITQADVISLHVPLTDETRGLIGAEDLSRMKPNALLVNASRGGVVDEAALAESLNAGHLGGAALDVFEEEPIPSGSPLLDAPRLLLTPHLGASTGEAQLGVALEVSRAIAKALVDGDMTGAVNSTGLEGNR